ncbi:MULTISPECIES: BA14K family protein [unclassified Rhizobium]|uniref:BA14K family protein n=1 Tax=unclassified Rhizobium TaxID=2613769 RepID=UPI001A99671A|nr:MULTISPECIES: BA14K family protein [unclassified Rhizobium]MBX5156163.1 BA14K family protein [Rhizobium sp. NZLR8]MBX5165711.1 BA14K family protein [Rhizobium sp. NZLR4b]MBX5172068.1 BA14K family protein [Rhizobium sp. NZLR1b]MBX5184477.1 BA14K family protein [Rhizobium sp. NZLR5]MBX5191639.1 BA14K family protein [Rhizobium sp. NZLR3b]
MPVVRMLVFAGLLAVLAPAMAGADSLKLGKPGIGPLNTGSTLCDFRGCFGFGPQQWHRPAYVQPNYRPRGATGPTYYQPGAAGRPQLTYEPPPVRRLQPKVADKNSHVAWCSNEYRSYDPRTDRFLTYEGIYKTCRSPYR